MELRLVVAYALIAVLASGLILWSVVSGRRRAARKLRQRGIKSDQRR